MDYEKAMTLYMKTRREIELIEADTAVKVAPLKEKLTLLMQWMEAKGNQDGLKNIPVAGVGTGYWTMSTSATVANPEAFWDFVKITGNYELVENRASSKAVKSYMEGHNIPVPGVNFSQTRVFKIRAASQSDKE